MKDIMKSQLFQYKKERLPLIVFIAIVGMILIFVLNEAEGNPVSEAACTMGIIVAQLAIMCVATVVSVFCGMDFLDQTSNYEIMSGHTREDAFLGRAVPAVLLGTLSSVCAILLVLIIGTLLLGWGDAVSLKAYLLHVVLLAFPYFRMACEFVCIVFIIRNPYLTLALGFFYSNGVGELLVGVSKSPFSFALGLTNLNRLTNFAAFSTYSPADPSNVMTVYDASLSLVDVLGTIGSSLGGGILFLLLGYHFFKTDDI